MNHEISELDIPDRQLLASNAKPSIWTEIGEAQITHTIFGRAKVRIIRKNENRHRIFWVLGVVVLAIAAAVWQGLFTLQRSEEDQNTDQSSVSAKVPVRAPVTQSEKSASPETPAESLGLPVRYSRPAADVLPMARVQRDCFAVRGSGARRVLRRQV